MLSLNAIVVGARRLSWNGRPREDGTMTDPGWKVLVTCLGAGGQSGELSLSPDQIASLSAEGQEALNVAGSRLSVDVVVPGAYKSKSGNVVTTLEAADGAHVSVTPALFDLLTGEPLAKVKG